MYSYITLSKDPVVKSKDSKGLKTLLGRMGGGMEGKLKVGGGDRRRASYMANMLTQGTWE